MLADFFAGISRSYYGNEPLGGPALVRSFKSVMHASDSLRIVMLAVFFAGVSRFDSGYDAPGGHALVRFFKA